MCGIPMIELHQDHAIYQAGAPRKALYVCITDTFHNYMIFLANSINSANKNYSQTTAL